MRTWLLHVGERLPVDKHVRSYRYGYLAQSLLSRGHQVLRWAPTFSHIEKRYRFSRDCSVELERDYSIRFVHGNGYRRNVGIGRLAAYQVLGHRLRAQMARETPPDLIVAAIPSLEWAAAAVEYGKSHNVPVIVDVRDLWPDVFLRGMPAVLRPVGRWAISPYEVMVRRICRHADALVGVSQGYLDWALSHAGRTQEPRDAVVPLGFEPEAVSAELLERNVADLRARGIDSNRPTCLFCGSFERSYDLETLIEAARRLSDIGHTNLQFVLCGDGSKRTALEFRTRRLGMRNVHFLGWVDAAMLQAAASMSCIGVCAYTADATQGLPNKPFEYMAGRLANVSCLQGELADLLKQHDCGITYDAGSVDSLVTVIDCLLRNRQLLESLRDHGFEAWQRHYRSRDIYAKFVEHLESLQPALRRAALSSHHSSRRRAA